MDRIPTMTKSLFAQGLKNALYDIATTLQKLDPRVLCYTHQ